MKYDLTTIQKEFKFPQITCSFYEFKIDDRLKLNVAYSTTCISKYGEFLQEKLNNLHRVTVLGMNRDFAIMVHHQ